MTTTRRLAMAAAGALCATAPMTAIAQQAQQFSDEEVGAFADALGAAAAVAQEWGPRIEAADSAEEARELTERSQAEMIAAIEGSGLTVETYTEIFASAQTDPELAQRIDAALVQRYGD